MIEITTKSSISVKPRREGGLCRFPMCNFRMSGLPKMTD
jgi:hypothetical protein